MKTLPIYNAFIGDEFDGIINVSLVDDPATLSNFMAFKDEKEMLKYQIQDEEQHILYGCIMRANFNIYRRDEVRGEYYLRYSPETIKMMAEKLMADGRQNCINIMHEDGSNVEGITMLQLFIKDKSNGIDPKGFEELEDGSLFAQYKVQNEAIWNEVKDGTFKGFSLEGYFTVEKANNKQEKNIDKMSRLKELLKQIFTEFASIVTDNGELFYDGDTLEVGTEVLDKEGNPVADGEYIADGKVYKVKEGKIEEIEEVEPEDMPEEKPVEEPQENTCNPQKNEEVAPTEEKPAEEPQPNMEVEKLQGQIDELRGVIEALTVRIEELEGKPCVEPIAEQFRNITVHDVKDTKIQRAMQIAEGIKN